MVSLFFSFKHLLQKLKKGILVSKKDYNQQDNMGSKRNEFIEF